MKRFLLNLFVVAVLLGGLLRFSLEFEVPQDIAMRQLASVVLGRPTGGIPQPDSLQIYVCGSASPLGMSDRAQTCLAVITPGHFYIVDSGAGSAANINAARLPMNRLQGVFVTHFHSDHIAELYELNLASWVRGRPQPLQVFGPRGVREVVNGINESYQLDRSYRIEHHGADFLPPDLGKLRHQTVRAGVVLEDGDLIVTAYIAEHNPASPALGYRFDYRGRSVVISGDSNVTPETKRIATNVDLLIHDALSVPAVTSMAVAAEEAGLKRMSKIMYDVIDYHASTDSIIELGMNTKIGMIAYYHLVPAPGNMLTHKFFERGLPENFVIAQDGDWFELPANSNAINVSAP